MVDRDPAPEGYLHHCTYCGKPLVDQESIWALGALPGREMVAAHFCSEACAESYENLLQEDYEESEEIFRAGAT